MIGQPTFGSGNCNNGGVTQKALCQPVGVALDSTGNLYVADYSNNRVLEYDNPFAPGGSATANLVFGQDGNFTTGSCNLNGATSTSLCNPNLIAVDPTGNLFVTDFANNRTLEFSTPAISGNTTASHVFGQGDNFTSNECDIGAIHPSAQTECNRVAVAADSSGNLFVADFGNNRTLKYDPPSVGPRGALFDHIPTGKSVTKTFYFQSSSLLVNISSIGFTGASAGNFSETDNCPAQLEPRSKCAITVTYKSNRGNPNAVLSVTDDAYNSPSTAQLR